MMKLVLGLLAYSFVSASFAEYISFFNAKDDEKTVNKVKLTKRSLSLSFSFSGIEVNPSLHSPPYKEGAFFQLKVKDLSNSYRAGNPSLPFKSMILTGYPKNIEVNVDKGKSYSITYAIPEPVKKMPCRCEEDEKLFPVINWESYDFPRESFVKLNYLGKFRGVPLTQVIVTPILLKKNAGVQVFPNLTVSFKAVGRTMLSEFRFFENKNKSGKNIFIIGQEFLLAGMKEFIARRRSQGYTVQIQKISGSENNTHDLKSIIKSAYQRKNFDFALIVGDESHFVTDYVSTSMDSQTPTDLNYFTMDGQNDRIPDVYYGRITARNVEQVERQVAKIIQFEEKSWDIDTGKDYIMGIASNEGYNPTDVEYMNDMVDPFKRNFFFKDDLYFQENLNSDPRNILNSLNRGAYWVNYIGHGSGDSWTSIRVGEFSSSHLSQMRPGGVLPVIIDVACQNGRFNDEGRLGETFMNQTVDGHAVGAVAFYGGSVNVSWHPPAIMAVAINRIVANKKTFTLGSALLMGQLKLIEQYDDANAALENLVWYHLLGDPSMNLKL